VHYDGDPARREEYRRFVTDGMRGGFAADDGAALHFVGTDLHRVVASRPGRRGWRVGVHAGELLEEPLDAEDLAAPAVALAAA
jgi:dipeptidase E